MTATEVDVEPLVAIERLPRPVVGILQPSYLPWIGAFDMMAACDLWIFYDDVQYTRRDWRNRNRIKGPNGPEYLTVPVIKAPRDAEIREIRIHEENDWAASHLARIRQRYRDSTETDRLSSLIQACLARRDGSLATLCIDLTKALARELGIGCQFALASDFAVAGRGAERIMALCREVGAASYVNGAAGRDLYDARRFGEIGVALAFHEYAHPIYRQPYEPFASHLSIVDLMAGHPPAVALQVLRSGSNLPDSGD